MNQKLTNLHRIQKVSGILSSLLTVVVILVPLTTLMYWLFFNSLPVGFKAGFPVRVRTEFPFEALLYGFMVSLLPLAAVLYGAFNLKKLFSLYKKGVVFSEQNVNCLRHIGYALISWVIANFTYVFLISVVVKYAVTSGSSQLVIRIGSSDIAILIIGAVIVLFSRVMKEAVILEDEHAHTV